MHTTGMLTKCYAVIFPFGQTVSVQIQFSSYLAISVQVLLQVQKTVLLQLQVLVLLF